MQKVFPKFAAHQKTLLAFPIVITDQVSDDEHSLSSDSEIEVTGVKWKAAGNQNPATGSDEVCGDGE